MKRIALSLAAVISFILMIGGGYAYYFVIPEKIEQQVIFGVSAFDFEKLTIDTIEKKSGMVVLSGISLDESKFSTIDSITVRFDPFKFLFDSDHALRMHIEGMKLTGEMDRDSNITIYGLKDNDTLLKNLNESYTSLIRVENSTLDLLSDAIGGIHLKYNGEVQTNSDGIELRGQARSKQKNLSFSAKIHGSTQKSGIFILNAEADQFSLTLPSLNIRRGVVKAQMGISNNQKSTLSIDTDFASLMWNNLPLRDIKMRVERSKGDNFNLSAEGNVYGTQQIEWNAQVDKKDMETLTNISVSPLLLKDLIDFLHTNNKLSSNASFPSYILGFENPSISVQATTNGKSNISGTFNLTTPFDHFDINGNFATSETADSIGGTFAMEDNHFVFGGSQKPDDKASHGSFVDMTASGDFIVRKLFRVAELEWDGHIEISDGIIEHGQFETPNIKGSVSYSSKTRKYNYSPLTFTLPLPQHIRHRGRINLNLKNAKAPILQTQSLGIYGGQIKTDKSIMSRNGLRNKNKLVVSDVNLTWLFEDAGFRNITIWGKMGGLIPYKLDGKEINVDGGILQSQSSGIIRLPDSVILSLFPGNSSKIQGIRQALKNYHYEYFEIRLDGDISDRVLMTLNATGHNPDISKDLVPMNLQIETQISLLFKNLLRPR